MESTSQNIVMFDGICNLCSGFVKQIIRLDKHERIVFCALQSDPGKDLLHKFSREKDIFSPDTVIYIRNGKCFDRSTAALLILKDLGGLVSVFSVLLIVPKPIRNLFYRVVAKYRYKLFGKKESCMMPTPELERRFLK